MCRWAVMMVGGALAVGACASSPDERQVANPEASAPESASAPEPVAAPESASDLGARSDPEPAVTVPTSEIAAGPAPEATSTAPVDTADDTSDDGEPPDSGSTGSSEPPVESPAAPLEPTGSGVAPPAETTITTPVVLDRPIERVVVVGDSVVFDARDRPGGRPNDIVPLIAARLAGESDLAHVEVENLALPGLATKYAINDKIDPTRDTLGEYLPMVFDAEADGSTLLLVALSSIDLNIMEALPIDDLVVELVEELIRLDALAASHDMPAVFVPVFGVNDAMYDDVRNGLSLERPEHHLAARVQRLNDELLASGLPMLVAGFDGLDRDGVGGADEEFFVDYDIVLGKWPDDGVHPNHDGEALYAEAVGAALVEVLRSAPAAVGA